MGSGLLCVVLPPQIALGPSMHDCPGISLLSVAWVGSIPSTCRDQGLTRLCQTAACSGNTCCEVWGGRKPYECRCRESCTSLLKVAPVTLSRVFSMLCSLHETGHRSSSHWHPHHFCQVLHAWWLDRKRDLQILNLLATVVRLFTVCWAASHACRVARAWSLHQQLWHIPPARCGIPSEASLWHAGHSTGACLSSHCRRVQGSHCLPGKDPPRGREVTSLTLSLLQSLRAAWSVSSRLKSNVHGCSSQYPCNCRQSHMW